MSQKDRKKASDVFRETNFFFSKKVTFEKAFPEIKDIRIEVIEADGPLKPDFDNPPEYLNNKMVYGKGVGEYIDCHNRFCYNGGFSIGSIIREMVQDKLLSKEGSAICQGYEGSPKGKRRYRSCCHHFYYRVKIEFQGNQMAQTT